MYLVLDYDRKKEEDPLVKIMIILRNNGATNLHRFIMTSIEFSLDIEEEELEKWCDDIHAKLNPIVKYRIHQKTISFGEGDLELDDKFKKHERKLELAGSFKSNH